VNKLIKTTSTNGTFSISDFEQTKQKVLNWVQQFSTFSFLDNHQYQIEPHTLECLLAAGIKRQLKVSAGTALDELQQFIDEKNSWLFGHLAYDLKNEIEKLTSVNPGYIGFPDLFFFEPEIIIHLTLTQISIEAENPAAVFTEISGIRITSFQGNTNNQICIRNRISRKEYLETIRKLKQHILRGDCYEINFCQEFFAENTVINPGEVYKRLSQLSPNPFSALYRVDNSWLLCASPERFLKRTKNKIISQPIKGTSKRNLNDSVADDKSKNELMGSAKDRSENVMVVDLVRNDLAKVCKEGSVNVDELFGIYSFPQVHQMISTISGELQTGISFTNIIKATFPMGSMTGAPKLRVLKLIEEYESTKRGIFSGAVGYISPNGNFDFNVVIRSIMYNADSKYLSFQAGSGITFSSDPEKEWEECLMKAEAMKKVSEDKGFN
jgi:para-aminobenzoate synthetase component 1